LTSLARAERGGCGKRLVCLILPLVLAACSQSETPAHPALWRATNGPVTLWLLGTIHLLPKNITWQGPLIERAVAESDALVLEIPAGDAPNAQTTSFLRYGRATNLPPVLDRVAPERQAALRDAIAASNMTIATLDGLKSWAAAASIGVGASRSVGASAANGVEAVLVGRFAGRPQQGLETLESQFAMLDALPEPAQRLLLDQAISEATGARQSYQATLSAWATGDVARIAKASDADFAKAPELEAALVTRRNRRWADALAARAPGTALVAVGAGHMVGPNALPALLNARGFRVARVQ